MRRSRAKGKNQAHAKGVSHMPDTWLEECVTKKKIKGKKHYFNERFNKLFFYFSNYR